MEEPHPIDTVDQVTACDCPRCRNNDEVDHELRRRSGIWEQVRLGVDEWFWYRTSGNFTKVREWAEGKSYNCTTFGNNYRLIAVFLFAQVLKKPLGILLKSVLTRVYTVLKTEL